MTYKKRTPKPREDFKGNLIFCRLTNDQMDDLETIQSKLQISRSRAIRLCLAVAADSPISTLQDIWEEDERMLR